MGEELEQSRCVAGRWLKVTGRVRAQAFRHSFPRLILVAIISTLLILLPSPVPADAGTSGDLALPPAARGEVNHHQPGDVRFPVRRQIEFERLSLEQGLSQSTVNAAVLDSHGFMWFGTDDGLNRYDGYTFQAYHHDPQDPASLPSDQITALALGVDGTLWVGTTEGLSRLDRETGQFTNYAVRGEALPSAEHNSVLALFVARSGALWVGASDGLYRFDQEREIFVDHRRNFRNPGGLGDYPVTAIYEDNAGVLWVGARRGLYGWPPEQQRFSYYRPNLVTTIAEHNIVKAICEDTGGALWIGTAGSGFYHFDPKSGKFTQYLVDPQDIDGFTYNDIVAIYRDQSSDLWIGTDGGGLYQFDRATQQLVPYLTDPDSATSLSSNYVRTIYEGQPGVLWVGTFGGGVNKLDRNSRKFIHFQHDPKDPDSLSHSRVLALLEDSTGKLWIGTDGGGLDRLDLATGEMRHFRHNPLDPDSLGSNYVNRLYEDHSDTLWIGTVGGGVNRYDRENDRFVHYRLNPLDSRSLSSDEALPMLVDQENTLWVAAWQRGLDRTKDVGDSETGEGAEFVHYRSATNARHRLSSPFVLDMVEDSDGILWIATATGGLNRFDPETETFRNFRADPEDPSSVADDRITALIPDPPAGLWLATASGLDYFDKRTETCTHYTTANGLAGNRINSMLIDDAGILWLATDRGLSRFNPHSQTFKNYGLDDGLQGYEFSQASTKGRDGTLYFGGNNGFNAFRPGQVKDNPYVPPVALTSLRQGGHNLNVGIALEELKGLTLRWPDNELEFEFAALNYSQPEQNEYAYMLEGFDSDWNYIGTRRFGKYTNLPGGTYTLRLRGSNNDGVWNTAGAALKISVVPPIWQTPWFQVLALLVLAVGIGGGYRLRVRGIQARSEELERQVNQRTQEIEEHRQELEALYQADQELYGHLQLDQVLQSLVHIAVGVLKADKSAVLCWDDPRERLVMRVGRGFSPEAMAQLSFARDEGLIGRVVATGEPAVIEDLRQGLTPGDERPEIVEIVLREGVRSFMQLPIKLNSEVFGVFNISYTTPHAFGGDEQRLFTSLAQRAAQAIENARLFDAEQRRAEQFRVISEVSRQVTTLMAVDQLLDQMARLIRDTFDFYHVGIGLIEDDEVVYRVGAGALWEEPRFQFEPARLKVGQEGISGWVAATGQPLMIPDVQQEPRYVWMQGSQTRSEVTVPIVVRGRVIGVLDAQSKRVDAFDESDMALLQALANQAGAAIENSQLYEQAQLTAVVQERSRLARDLHDAVTQTLFSASLLAEVLPTTWDIDRQEGEQLLQELRQLSRGALAEMRALLLELRPAALIEADLGDLLRQLAEAATGRIGVPVQVSVEGDCDLSDDVHVAFYRITQEALNNVVKHSRASQVWVRLSCVAISEDGADEKSTDQIELCISDNGIGFDPRDVTPDRLGLGIIRERAQAIGAGLSIDSRPGKGTKITVHWQDSQESADDPGQTISWRPR